MCECANLTLIEGLRDYHDGFTNYVKSFNHLILQSRFKHPHICTSAHSHIILIFAPASLIRPAPAEPPQGRKAARVGGRSGAM